MSLPIEDYALVGNCLTAALVGKDGSVDWLCLPRFDSAACFAALLGTPDNGRWRIHPVGVERCRARRYQEGTLILETDFETDDGAVTIIDFMPLPQGSHEMIRMVVGRRGTVEMEMDLVVRYDYGSIVPWVSGMPRGLRAVAGPDTLRLRTDVELKGQGLRTVARFVVHPNQRVPFVLSWYPSHHNMPPDLDPRQALVNSQQWWSRWSNRCTYQGDWQEPVRRSLITLKGLTYEPSGGIIAAPTTSLPEDLGGKRNWDYRYCWVRDATFTLYALLIGGYRDESRQWRQWLLRAVAGTPEQLQIMYGIEGNRRLTEFEVEWLSGYEDSKPVRIGNAAHSQLQLDVFGEVMDCFHLAHRAGLKPLATAWHVQRRLLDYLETLWRKPDEGLWEIRGEPQHFTHSKVMAWVAFDRAVKAIRRWGLEGPVERWTAVRDEIRQEVLDRAFDPKRNSFMQAYGSPHLDAATLMIPLVGFLPATDPRMQGTVQAIEENLRLDGFVRRYHNSSGVDGVGGDEGAFLVCSFWLADNYELMGDRAKAVQLFEKLLSLRNDVGLLSEEYDPRKNRMLGNFPQALSHVGLINTARNLSDKPGGPAYQRHK